MRKSLFLTAAILAAPAFAQQSTSYGDGDRKAGVTAATPQGTGVIPLIACTDTTNTRISCAGSGGGGSTPTGTAGSPNANVVTVQGISGGTVIPVTSSPQPDQRVSATVPSNSGQSYIATLGSGLATVSFTVTGLTAAGGTLTANYSDDNQVTYFPLRYMGTATVPGTTTITADGVYTFAAGAHTHIRLQFTTAGNGNNVTFVSNASVAPRVFNLEGAGTAATNPFYANVNNYQLNGVAIAAGAGGSNTGTQRVILSSDSTVTATQATGTNLHTVVDSGTVTANLGTLNGAATAANQPARDTNNDLRVPTVTITETSVSLTANTSGTLIAANTARIGLEIQCDGTAIVGISRTGATLTSAAASPLVIPTGSYPLYVPPYASKTAITYYTATAQTCRVTQYAQQ